MQSHFVDEMPTVLVAPLVREARGGDFSKVSVPIAFSGEGYYLSLAEMAPFPKADLGPTRGNLIQHEDDIRRALDRLFTGF